MAYIGQGIKQGTFKVLDTSGNTYNGSNTTFNLGTQVGSAAQLLVSHDGVIQKAGTDYTLATGGTQITFSTAPASGASIFITEISGAVGGTVTPSDTSVTADKLNSALLTGHTDIGGAIADADLFLTDDGAGGTLRKTAASRLKTYVGAGAGAFSIANLDIDGGTDIGADIVDADLFIIDDGAGGTNRKVAASRIKTYAGGVSTLLHEATVTGETGGHDDYNDSTYFAGGTYDRFRVYIDDFEPASDGTNLLLQLKLGGVLRTNNYEYHTKLFQSNSDAAVNRSTGTSGIRIIDDVGTGGDEHARGWFEYTARETQADDRLPQVSYHFTSSTSGNNFQAGWGGGQCYDSTGTLTGFRLIPTAGALGDYKIRIYGIKS